MTDEELVYLMREKNEDAESIFVKRYERVIQRLSFSTVGHFAHDSEVKSTAYMVLMQCIQSYDEKLNSLFMTYYHTCLKKRLNSLLKQYRYSEKRRWLYDYQDIHEVEVGDYTLHDPIQNYIVDEEYHVLKAYLNDLEWRIFQMCTEGYKSAEIADVLNIQIKKVYNTVHKIKKMLKS